MVFAFARGMVWADWRTLVSAGALGASPKDVAGFSSLGEFIACPGNLGQEIMCFHFTSFPFRVNPESEANF
jgi:hypothetical protein